MRDILELVMFGSTLVVAIERVIEWLDIGFNFDALVGSEMGGKRLKVALSVVLGQIMAIGAGIDVFGLIQRESPYPIVGTVLSGLLLAGGSNIFNTIVNRLNVVPVPAAPANRVADSATTQGDVAFVGRG